MSDVFSKRMGLAAAANFCRRFGTAVRSGMDLMRLLDMETKQGPAQQRAAMMGLHDGAKNGETLTTLMEEQKPFFPPLLVAMTRAGEATGRLDRTLLELANHYDSQLKLRRSFMTSISWSLIQLFAGIGVVSLLIWIMGVLTPPGGGKMPDILGFGLSGTSGVLKFWGYVAVFFGMVAAGIWAYRNNIGGVQNLIPLVYMIPVAGPEIQTIAIARFAWTLALCLDAGLDPIQAVRLALDSTDSDYYRSATDQTEVSIRSGKSLAETLNATHLFPENFITHIDVAEMSGTDAESIDSLAKDYEERAKIAVRTLGAVATGLIWLLVTGMLIFGIFRIASFVFGVYSEALEPI